jgi:hypothetical protein
VNTVLSTLPAQLDLQIYAGEPYSAGFQFNNQDGTPYVLTGTWQADIRDQALNAVLTSFTVDTTNEAAGLVVISLTKANISAIPSTSPAAWDLQQCDAGGLPVRTWFRGALTVTADVTRV